MHPISMDTWFMGGALAVSVLGAVWDIRQRRIPNRLTFAAMAAALVLRTGLLGWKGLAGALVGGLIGGGVFLVLYAIRAMGAGDVKLMAAVGALVGPEPMVTVLLATALAGGILALAVMLWRRQFVSTLGNTVEVLRFHLSSGLRPHPEINLDNPAAVRLPYGIAIAAGTAFSLVSATVGR